MKKSQSKLSMGLFGSGVIVVGLATGLVKLTSDPKMEIIWGFIATGGVVMVALSKYT